ncbi:MAG: hypothetical protein HQK55_15890, partial [Deltaproteobacteria bacterium]|nr:hypothetical protein [Deltaproteobacteria bacterium]
LLLLMATFAFAQGTVPESGPISARIGKMIYDRLGPRVDDLANINEDLKSIRKNVNGERDFNLVNELIFNSEMLTTYGATTVKLLQLNEQIKDEYKSEYFRRQATDAQTAAKKVRAHVDEITRLYKFIKVSSIMPTLDRAMDIYPQVANDLDLIALMLQKETQGGQIKEQKLQ